MVPESSPPNSVRLDSWKEIAAYLQRDIRTVQRWEKQEGLPVRRHMHGERGTVYAYPAELDDWWSQRLPQPDRPTPEPAAGFRAGMWALVGAGLIAVTAAAIWMRAPHRPTPVNPEVTRMGRLLANATAEGHQPLQIPLPDVPGPMALTPDGSEGYITHSSNNSLSVMDMKTLRVTHRVDVVARPIRAVASPDGKHVYVGGEVGDVSIVDTATKKVRTIVTGGRVNDLAITPDGSKLFLAMEYSGLKRVLTETGEIGTLPGTVCPMFLAMSPVGTRLYVSYQCGGPGGRPGHDSIDVVDTVTERSVGTIAGPPLVGGPIAITPDGQHIWVSAMDACAGRKYDAVGCPSGPARTYHVFRTSDLSLLQTIAFPWVDAGGYLISIYPDGSRAILSGGELRVVDAARFTTVEELLFDSEDVVFYHAVFSPDRKRVYIPRTRPNALAVFDLLPQSHDPPTTAGLTAFWPGDGTAEDAHDGATPELKNGASFGPGRIGRAFRLDGVDDFIRIARDESAITTMEGTFAAWVKVDRVGREMTVADRQFGQNIGWRMVVNRAAHLEFCLAGGTGCLISTTSLVAGRWYHLAGVRSGTRLALYVNGVREADRALTTPVPVDWAGKIELHLGASHSPGAFLEGSIDEALLYRRALEPAEIRQLAQASAGT